MQTMTELELLRQRIDHDLVAFGEFQASDIVQNSVCQADFTNIEPGHGETHKPSQK
jgi:hypothetical protein